MWIPPSNFKARFVKPPAHPERGLKLFHIRWCHRLGSTPKLCRHHVAHLKKNYEANSTGYTIHVIHRHEASTSSRRPDGTFPQIIQTWQIIVVVISITSKTSENPHAPAWQKSAMEDGPDGPNQFDDFQSNKSHGKPWKVMLLKSPRIQNTLW